METLEQAEAKASIKIEDRKILWDKAVEHGNELELKLKHFNQQLRTIVQNPMEIDDEMLQDYLKMIEDLSTEFNTAFHKTTPWVMNVLSKLDYNEVL
jgi:hypothetical protein